MDITRVKDWITLIGVFVGPWIAVKLSIRQFKAQRWWERKAETYIQILETLSILRWNISQSFNREVGATYFPPVGIDGSPLFVLEKIASTGNYIISERAARALTTFISDYADAIRATTGIANSLDEQWGAANTCIEIIQQEANRDVKSDLKFFQSAKWKSGPGGKASKQPT